MTPRATGPTRQKPEVTDIDALLERYFPSRYDETPLDDFSDPLDEAVFQAVLRRFESDVQAALRSQDGHLPTRK